MSARGAIAARPAWAEGAVVRATVFAVVRSRAVLTHRSQEEPNAIGITHHEGFYRRGSQRGSGGWQLWPVLECGHYEIDAFGANAVEDERCAV